MPSTSDEVWYLSSFKVAAYTYPYLQAKSDTTDTPTAVCPVRLLPATLSYTAAGTYTHVLLAQVDSGPSANGVALSTLSFSPGISITNLSYVPGDAAQPVTPPAAASLNPNSVYGDVTVAPGAISSSVYLQFAINGAAVTRSLLTVSVAQ